MLNHPHKWAIGSTLSIVPFLTGCMQPNRLPVKPFQPPISATNDVKHKYDLALAEMHGALSDFAKELTEFYKDTSILDVPKLIKGIDVTVIPSKSGHQGCAYLIYRNDPKHKIALPAAKRAIDAMMKFVAVEGQIGLVDHIYENFANEAINQYFKLSEDTISKPRKLRSIFVSVLKNTVETSKDVSGKENLKSWETPLGMGVQLYLTIKNPDSLATQQIARQMNAQSSLLSAR